MTNQFSEQTPECCSFSELVDRVHEATSIVDHESPQYASDFARKTASLLLGADLSSVSTEFETLSAVIEAATARSQCSDMPQGESCFQNLTAGVMADLAAALTSAVPKLTARVSQYLQCQFGLGAQAASGKAAACVTLLAMALISGKPLSAAILDFVTCLVQSSVAPGGGNQAPENPAPENPAPVPENPIGSFTFDPVKRC